MPQVVEANCRQFSFSENAFEGERKELRNLRRTVFAAEYKLGIDVTGPKGKLFLRLAPAVITENSHRFRIELDCAAPE